MAELFKIRLTLLEGQQKKKYVLFARRGETLLETIQRELHDKIELRLDSKYGLEVTRIDSLSKNEKEGVHFWIGKKVPFILEGNEKLYLSLYHIQVDRNMHLRLELVSASCDFVGSVVDPRLDVRVSATDCKFEKLQSFKIESTSNPALWKMPIYSEIQYAQAFQSPSIDYFRYYLQQNIRSLGGWRKKPREPDFPKDFALHGVQLRLSKFPTRISEHPQEQSFFQLQAPSAQISGAADAEKWGWNANLQSEAKKTSAERLGQEQAADNRVGTGIRPANIGSTGSSRISKEKAETYAHVPSKQLLSRRSRKSAIQLSSLTDFKAAIFDLDGIIVDSEKAHLLTFNQVLRERGLKIGERMWRSSYTGIGSVKIMEDVFRRNGIQEDILPTVVARAKIYKKHVEKNGLPEIAGFKNFQRFLSKNKVKFMVASGGHKPSIAASLRSIGLPQVKFVGLEDVKHGKPNPEIFLLAAKKLGVKPAECIVFEDSLSGMEAAARAGMPCIALPTTLPVRILKGKASAIFKDYNSPGLKALMARLICRRSKKSPVSLAKKGRVKNERRKAAFLSGKKVAAKKNRGRKRKFRRPRLLRLGRR